MAMTLRLTDDEHREAHRARVSAAADQILAVHAAALERLGGS